MGGGRGREKGKLVAPKMEKGKLGALKEKRENGGKDFRAFEIQFH